jgi:hypothetical protein
MPRRGLELTALLAELWVVTSNPATVPGCGFFKGQVHKTPTAENFDFRNFFSFCIVGN